MIGLGTIPSNFWVEYQTRQMEPRSQPGCLEMTDDGCRSHCPVGVWWDDCSHRATYHGTYLKHGKKNIGIWQNIEFLLVFVLVNETYHGNQSSFVWISFLAFFFHDVTCDVCHGYPWDGGSVPNWGNTHGIVITHSNRKSLIYRWLFCKYVHLVPIYI